MLSRLRSTFINPRGGIQSVKLDIPDHILLGDAPIVKFWTNTNAAQNNNLADITFQIKVLLLSFVEHMVLVADLSQN